METKTKKNLKFRNSISFKLIIIATLSLLLLIPSAMIKGLIRERESRKFEIEREITDLWGNEQNIQGPILKIPYEYYVGVKNKVKRKDFIYLTPENLTINGNLHPEKRHRGIFDVITYKSEISLNGTFRNIGNISLPHGNAIILHNDVQVLVGINDLRGIDTTITVNWNNQNYQTFPGVTDVKLLSQGFHSKVIANTDKANTFQIALKLNGSKTLSFCPIAKTTTVQLSSSWEHPSFYGSFLPDNHNINKNGFKANWNILEINRSIPNMWTKNSHTQTINNSMFGVELIESVDNYQKTERSVKYAILFIVLTFLIIFFKEVIGKDQVHPVQYLIIGFTLVIFYSVLLALAEHIGFNLAYLVSSIVIIGMIGLYATSILKKRSGVLMLSLVLVLMYSFLFVVLQVSDFALLLGNIGILIVLGAIMYFSRKIDWNTAHTDLPVDKHVNN